MVLNCLTMNFLKTLTLLIPCLLGMSCAGIGFEKAWTEAVAEQKSGKNSGAVTGPWAGTWKTDNNGHEGKLRCLVTPSDSQGAYDFRYHATWFKILRGGYDARFDVSKAGNGYAVEGKKNLGFFGEFEHSGRISGNRFDGTYSNEKGDVGSFQMTRPQ